MKKITATLLLVLVFTGLKAQFSLPYKLNPSPDFTSYTKDYDLATTDELDVLDERVVEYSYDKEGNLFEYFYVHEVKYVNSEDAIDRNNKIYISLSRALEMVSYDARVILSGGLIKSLGKDALKEGKDEDERKVHYFAVSGAEKGSYIEYYYLIKRNAGITGTYMTFQGDQPVAKAMFKIISPDNLVFTSKSYNGFPDMKADSSLSDRNMLAATQDRIPKLDNESFANEGGSKMMVLYQLFYNSARGKKNPYNYGIASQNIFENICGELKKDEKKVVQKLLKQSNLKYQPDEESKVRAIENFVKRTFNYVEANDERLENIASMKKLGYMNENGATRLIYHMLEEAGIESEIVVTTSRYKLRFDPDFESYSFLSDFLIYIPSLKKYLSPISITYRLGIIPYGYIENYALFIRKVEAGEMKTGAGKVKYISAGPSSETLHNMYITAKLDNSTDSLEIDFKQVLTGYYANNYQPLFEFIPKEKLKDFEEGIIKGLNEEITIKTMEFENKGAENLMVKPFVAKSKLTSQHFVEKAGNKILIKFGELIGPQSELYQEKNRVLPIENDFNREYHREIVFIIPDGYKIKNPEALTMAVQPFLQNGDVAGFTSSYTIENNKLTVKCDEYYKQIRFPLSDYENYRAVINAAANFNKITLVLEKL